VILTGITDFVSRGDLIDLCVFIHTPTIPESRRCFETDFRREFDAAQPQLLGALYEAVAKRLAMLPQVRCSSLPRMADFALFGEAVIRALGYPGDRFLTAYRANRQAAKESALEDSPVAAAVRELTTRSAWTGTASEVLDTLAEIAGENVTEAVRWPKSPRGMAGPNRRLAPSLRAVSIHVEFGRGHNRYIHIGVAPGRDPGIPPTVE
jgi:hypothetical protein